MEMPDCFVTYAFRYCFGRRSYAVGDFCDWAMKNIQNIAAQDRRVMIREIKENEEYPTLMGDEMDRVRWIALKDALEKQEALCL